MEAADGRRVCAGRGRVVSPARSWEPDWTRVARSRNIQSAPADGPGPCMALPKKTAKKPSPKPIKAKSGRPTARRPKAKPPQAKPLKAPVARPAPPAAPPAAPASPAGRGIIVVDGSNVAMTRLKDGLPALDNVQLVHDALSRLGFQPVIFVDATLRHNIPAADRARLEHWMATSFVVQAPKGVRADEAILEFAHRKDAKVLSNDAFAEFHIRYPWVAGRTRRFPFNIVLDELIIYESHANVPRRPAATRPAAVTMAPGRRRPPTVAQQPARVPAPPTRGSAQELAARRALRRPEALRLLIHAFERSPKTGDHVLLQHLAAVVRRIDPRFQPGDYGYSRFLGLVESFPEHFRLNRVSPEGLVGPVDGSPAWPLKVKLLKRPSHPL